MRAAALSALLILTLPAALPVVADDTDFRLGAGRYVLNADPSSAVSSDGNKPHYGWSISGEMPQSDHTASKATIYHISDDRVDVTGIEMQIQWGIGLSSPGFRLYAGPGWFFENNKDRQAEDHSFSHHSDFALSAGTGYRWQSWVLDFNYQYRPARSYEKTLRDRGIDEKARVYTTNLSLAYRF